MKLFPLNLFCTIFFVGTLSMPRAFAVDAHVAPLAISDLVRDQAESTSKVVQELRAPKPTGTAKKGVIYLPVVSLSSYLPMAAQILLMILVISLSGLFGAWLMFRTLARKVLTIEEATRHAQPETDAEAFYADDAPELLIATEIGSDQRTGDQLLTTIPDSERSISPATESIASNTGEVKTGTSVREFFLGLNNVQREILAPVLAQSDEGQEILRTATSDIYRSRDIKRRRTLFLNSEKASSTSEAAPVKEKSQAEEHASRMVLKSGGRTKILRGAHGSDRDKTKRIPDKFLINDWFPMDQ